MLDFISVNEHSSIRLKGNVVIYVDPFRIPKEANDGDLILITHSHYDHFSPEDICKLAKKDTLFVMPETMVPDAHKEGISEECIYPMNPGDSLELLGVKVEAVPSYNTNKPMHPKENKWLGYIITIRDLRIYIAGDCDYMPEGKKISCDVAMIPIGGTYTMNPREAAEYVNELNPTYVIPIHYGTLVGVPEDFDAFTPFVKKEIKIISKLP